MARGTAPSPPPPSSYASEEIKQADDIHRHYLQDQSSPNHDPSASSSSSSAASVNALSFSFVATAVLISLFLLMAIFERFLRPIASSSSSSSSHPSLSPPSPSDLTSGSDKTNQSSRICEYVGGITVVMPGEDYPTFIAKPAPLTQIEQVQKTKKLNQREEEPQYEREQEKAILKPSPSSSSSS